MAPDTFPFRVVDLTATLSPETVMWPGDPPPSVAVVGDIERDGSYSRQVTLGEHSGTHFDAPCHFASSGASVADIPAEELVRPLRVIDISERASDDPDTALAVEDIVGHEAAHGLIERGTAVFVRTGWDIRRHAAEAYVGTRGVRRFPGFGVSAARLLVQERAVSGLGIDTLSIDVGCSADLPVHSSVSLPHGVWHVENAVNLEAVPAAGAWVVIGVPKLADASGFPARVLALLPHP